MNTRVFVGNLPYNISDDAEFFNMLGVAGVGAIKEHRLIVDRTTNRSKGFGFVEFNSSADALAAIQILNGYNIERRTLNAELAKQREAPVRPGGGGGPRGGSEASRDRDEHRGNSKRNRDGGSGGHW